MESGFEEEIVHLSARFWDLAQSDLPNGIAMMEMAGILQEIAESTDSSPIVVVGSFRPEPADPYKVDFEMLRAAYLAENFWMSTYLKFNDREKPYCPPSYSKERDALDDGKTNKLEVRDAGEAGQGLYARDKIGKGETVFVSFGNRKFFCSPYESRKVLEDMHEGKRNFSLKARNPDLHFPNAICISQEDLELMVGMRIEDPNLKTNVWLDPSSGSPLRFLNHSCEPNLKRTTDALTFVAMRDLKPGEQLTCDYATLEVNPDWRMDCSCGSEHCRKVVGGIQSLPDECLETYGRDLPPFMMDLFRKTHTGIDRKIYEINSLVRLMY